MTFDTILFDLDDTILDRDESLLDFISAFIEKYSNELDDESKRIFEKEFPKLDEQGYSDREEIFSQIIKLLSWKHVPALQELIGFWDTQFPKCAKPAADLHDVLVFFKAKNIKMGIITNGVTAFQNTKIDKLKIRQYMKMIIISEEAGIRKPDPGIFKLALAKINSSPNTTLFVGDNPVVDIKGANDSGLISVWLNHDQNWDIKEYKPMFTINSLSDLKNI